MKNFTLKSIFTVLALLLAVTSYSQDRTCGMMEYMEEMLKDPVLAKQHEENQKKFKAEVAKRVNQDYSTQGGGTIVIPVAVHFMTGNTGDRACLEALAQNQIDILNADYTATNADIATWNNEASVFYPGLVPGSANISFCLATSNHPAAVPQLVEGQPAVTIGYNFANGSGFPEFDSNFQGYMNFVVKPIGGLLGYSPLGGSVTNGMAVVMNTFAFGSGSGCPTSGIVPGAPYNLGRTVTHELGHFYNLSHTFNGDATQGDPNAVCGSGTGDTLADTPEVASATYGCPANTAGGLPASCSPPQRALTMNYMDYVNDACMYMFTPQQINRVDTYVSAVLNSQFKPNVCAPATPGFNITATNSPISTCPNIDTEAVFNLTYTTTLDFSENTMFTASGQPAGSTVTFNPTSLNADGNVTMTIGNLGATAEGDFTITVTGTSTTVTETVDVLLENACTEEVCTPYASGNLGLPIADGTGTTTPVNGPVLFNSIIVPDEGLGEIESMTVTVDVSHTWVSDLLVAVLPPGGAFPGDLINLWSGDCTDNDDFDVTFEDGAGAIVCGSPTVGTFSPVDALSSVSGLQTEGDWQIVIADFFAGDTGQLNNWSIEFCTQEPLGIDEFTLDNFVIFPNPNQGEFTIKLNSNSGNDIKVDVFDIRGRRIFNNVYTNTGDFNETVNLNNVQSGMYLVTVNDGNKEVTKRIIVD